jgi:dTDP-4-amino-4,6-dideoxygalactose transaminase
MIVSPEILKQDKNLAINGGRSPIQLPYEDTGIITDAAEAVADVVRTGRTSIWRGGPKAKLLEKRFSEFIGRKGAFFHNSGSAALLTGLHALGADENSTVAITSSGFVSSINAVYHVRSRPVFLPTDERTLVCKADVSAWVDEPVDIALVTQFLGNVVDVDSVMKTSKARLLHEDSSQALGSRLNGQYAGARGAVSSYAGSFRKLLGSGQGGVNIYDDEELGERMRVIAHHGKGHTQYGEVPGFNFRGGEMEATLALAAFDQLKRKIELRIQSANAYIGILTEAGIPVVQPPQDLDCRVVWFDIAAILPEEWEGSRDWLVEMLNLEGVPAFLSCSLIEMPWVKKWMEAKGWWSDREEELLKRERKLWSRVFLVGSQMNEENARRCGEIVAQLLVR